MTTAPADVLTVVFQAARRLRRVTFTDVRYGVTWNRLFVAHACGDERAYDRLDIIDIQSHLIHHRRVSQSACPAHEGDQSRTDSFRDRDQHA